MKRLAVVCGVLLLLAGPVLAADINPPPWWPIDPGEPPPVGATYQGWEFMTDDPVSMPDFGDNPYGFSPAEVLPIGPWIDELMPFEYELGYWVGVGVWPLSGEIIVPINNIPRVNEQKIIWVQLTWMPQQDPASRPVVEEIEWNGGPGTIVNEEPIGPDWIHTTYEIVLPFNPDHEVVYIQGDIYVDELVIDTLCTPEPATLALMGLGSLLMVVRRRR